jgi:hypothetical protein
MNPELLKTEVDLAEQAELESDEQLRKLTALIDKAGTPGGPINASDCAKLVTAALALNERLRERTRTLQLALKRTDTAS